jgi:hypothetical protein
MCLKFNHLPKLYSQVTNPLSVKTKVHVPRSPSALLSATEREKIFLEVHIQNLTQEPMWFERMSLEAVDGWTVEDGNVVGAGSVKESIFSGSIALMQPQDMRQYVYTMTPVLIPSFPVIHTPGSIIPLGRLDISWRSSFGEPGRLLTSVNTYFIFPSPTISHNILSDAFPPNPSTGPRPGSIRNPFIPPAQYSGPIRCTASSRLPTARPITTWYSTDPIRLSISQPHGYTINIHSSPITWACQCLGCSPFCYCFPSCANHFISTARPRSGPRHPPYSS